MAKCARLDQQKTSPVEDGTPVVSVCKRGRNERLCIAGLKFPTLTVRSIMRVARLRSARACALGMPVRVRLTARGGTCFRADVEKQRLA